MSRALLLTLCLFSLLTVSFGQEVIPTPVVLPAESASPEPVPVDENFISPQASLDHFLAVMTEAGPLRPGRYLLGPRHLDLSEIPAVVREERGIPLAQQLYELLSPLDLSKISQEPTAEAEEVLLHRYPSGDQISMRRQSDGRWLFSAATVRAVPLMHDALVASSPEIASEQSFLDRSYLGVSGHLGAGTRFASALVPCRLLCGDADSRVLRPFAS